MDQIHERDALTLIKDPRTHERYESSDITSLELSVPEHISPADLFGVQDRNLREIERRFSAQISVRSHNIRITGTTYEVPLITQLFKDLMKRIEQGIIPDVSAVQQSIDILKTSDLTPHAVHEDLLLTYKGKQVRPKTAGQKRYCDSIRKNTITFGVGPAGTGKTYLAMALAIAAFQRKEVSKIILSRPVVEAGENLGFLPGSLEEKVDPYVRPLYDALFTMMDRDKAQHLLEKGVIEIAPLAFMRGRTLTDAFVILDEAQNTTPEQMKMFLTRLGFGSTFVITGDLTQTDLPRGVSGLSHVQKVLTGIPRLEFVYLDAHDVVRHSLVSHIVEAYARWDQSRQADVSEVSANTRRPSKGDHHEA